MDWYFKCPILAVIREKICHLNSCNRLYFGGEFFNVLCNIIIFLSMMSILDELSFGK